MDYPAIFSINKYQPNSKNLHLPLFASTYNDQNETIYINYNLVFSERLFDCVFVSELNRNKLQKFAQ